MRKWLKCSLSRLISGFPWPNTHTHKQKKAFLYHQFSAAKLNNKMSTCNPYLYVRPTVWTNLVSKPEMHRKVYPTKRIQVRFVDTVSKKPDKTIFNCSHLNVKRHNLQNSQWIYTWFESAYTYGLKVSHQWI